MNLVEKKKMKTKYLIVIVITIIVISILFALTFEYPIKNKDHSNISSLSSVPEIINYKGKDCNASGIDNVNCFVDSFNKCLPAKIENTHHTIEGDPITIIALIKSECTIDTFMDSTQDRFGKQEITRYTCDNIKLDDHYLHLIQCVDESGHGDYYGFTIEK
jgi:hypothetical protein